MPQAERAEISQAAIDAGTAALFVHHNESTRRLADRVLSAALPVLLEEGWIPPGGLERAEYVLVERLTRDFQTVPARTTMTREAAEVLYRKLDPS